MPDRTHGPTHTKTGAIGIDFGTTNSSVARFDGKSVELVHFGGRGPSSRSLLYVEKSAKGVHSSSGGEAIARYLTAHEEGGRPGRLIQSLKSYLPARSLTGTEILGRRYQFEDLVARILTDLRLAAEAQFGHPVTHVTAGRPVHFAGAETAEDDAFAEARLRDAYHRAGFEQVDFELEPIAAALKYGATLDHTETILIGDFGGGTSDFSIITVGGGGLGGAARRQVLANAGLGFAGDAFDARIVRRLISPALGSETVERGEKQLPAVPAWIYANLERWHYLSFLRTRNVLEILRAAEKRAVEPEKITALLALIEEDLGYQLHQAVGRTKAALSPEEASDFVFAGPQAGTLELRTRVERRDFEEWIAPELEAMERVVDGLVASSGVPVGAIDRVFLTGGTSFVPAVRRIFEARFPGRITAGGEFTSVAEGLALAAAHR